MYHTGASCGGIQLILAVRSFHTGPFPTVVYGDMVHRKKALNCAILAFSRFRILTLYS
jgi:hypothetical protein